MLQYPEPGTEPYVFWAKKKICEWHAEMLRTGLRSQHKVVQVDSGITIYVDMLNLGRGLWNDKVRIAGGGARWRSEDGAIIYRGLTPAKYSAFIVGTGDWSKDTSTYVLFDGSTGLTIYRGSVTASFVDAVQLHNAVNATAPVVETAYGAYTSNAFGLRLANGGIQFRARLDWINAGWGIGAYVLDPVLSADGARIVATSSTTADSFALAQWNATTGAFVTSRVALPPLFSELLAQYLSAGCIRSGNTPTSFGALTRVVSFPPWPDQLLSVTVQMLRLVHPCNSSKGFVFFRIGGYTSGSGDPVTGHYTAAGTVHTVLCSYDFDTGAWATLRDTEVSLANTNGVVAVTGAAETQYLSFAADGTYEQLLAVPAADYDSYSKSRRWRFHTGSHRITAYLDGVAQWTTPASGSYDVIAASMDIEGRVAAQTPPYSAAVMLGGGGSVVKYYPTTLSFGYLPSRPDACIAAL